MVRKKYSGDEPKTAKLSQRTTTTNLPQEVVYQFLLLLPAQLLHDVVRHVCREWSLITRSPNFAHHHYRNSVDGGGGGLLIQPLSFPRKGFYLEMRGGRLEISELDCGFNGTATSSCNGLVLTSDMIESEYRPKGIYVANPLTKQSIHLPQSRITVYREQDSALAFLEASMVYKVVRARGVRCANPKTHIEVLTIGVDRLWRRHDIRPLLVSSEEGYFCNYPLVTGGCYVHWAMLSFVLTMNLETETVGRFSPPPLPPGFKGTYLAMGSNLSFVHCDSGKCWRDVWEMNSVTGEWTQLCRIDEGPIKDRFKGSDEDVIPICWLAAGEVLVFVHIFFQKSGIACNVKTGEIQSFEWGSRRATVHHFQPHVNSLVWFDG